MTKTQGETEPVAWKALLAEDADCLRAMVEAVVQATLEAEMTEALGAAKGERTPERWCYVLPGKSPVNGGVERANGDWRYQFCACYDPPHHLDELKRLIDSFAHAYNHYRQHCALQGRTLAVRIQTLTAKEAPSLHSP